MNYNINEILVENERRIQLLNSEYDPLTGIGSPIEREKLVLDDLGEFYIPKSFFDDPIGEHFYNTGSIGAFAKSMDISKDDAAILYLELRSDHDFEFYANFALNIEHKETAEIVSFTLRYAQRKLLYELEAMRLAGVPIRVVLLKARQWGGSTLVQMYMFWIQQRLKKNWHISVCAQDDNAAKNIRAMYERAAQLYPELLGSVTLGTYAKSNKNLICKETGGIIGVGSINEPDQFRSYSNKMIHMSELGVWHDTPKRTGKKIAASLKNAIANVPYSLIVEESTAQGVGNYFHDEWTAAENGESNYKAVFVPWFEIEMYQKSLTRDKVEFVSNMTKNDWYLWSLGATLENINWYKWFKKGERKSDTEMMEEYPGTPQEAFISSGHRRYPDENIINVRKTVKEPLYKSEVEAKASKGKDAFENIRFSKIENGRLNIWEDPQTTIEIEGVKYRVTDRYGMFVDFGGTHKKADRSAAVVMDRYWITQGGKPEVVAVWHGHMEAIFFAWVCGQIGWAYDKALLAFESNTPDQKREEITEDHFLTAITQLAPHYPNLYIRNKHDSAKDTFMPVYGFHTNKQTKPMIIDAHAAGTYNEYGDTEYIERFAETANEMTYFEKKPDGKLGAIDGKHDDLVMATAGCFWLCTEYMPPPRLVPIIENKRKGYGSKSVISEASL